MESIKRLFAIILIVVVTIFTSVLATASVSNQSEKSFVQGIMQDRSEWLSTQNNYEYEFYPHQSDYNLDDLVISVDNGVGDISITTSNLLYIKVGVYNVQGDFEQDIVELENNELKINNNENTFFSNSRNNTRVNIQVPSGFHGSIRIVSGVGDVTVSSLTELNALNIQCDNGDISVKNVGVNGDTTIVSDTGDIKLSNLSLLSAKIATTTGDINFSGDFEGICGFDSNQGDIKVTLNGNVEDYSVDLSCLGNCSYNSKSVSGSYTYNYSDAINWLVARTSVGKVTVIFK